MTIRIAIAEDHPIVLCGLTHELQKQPDFDLVCLARNGAELADSLSSMLCEVVVTDYSMPSDAFCDGVALVMYLREQYPHIKIVVFAALNNQALSNHLKSKGAYAVVNKTSDTHLLVAAIRAAHASVGQLDSDAVCLDQRLTPREDEVIRLYLSGLSIGEIAELLGRKKQTISAQRISAMHKLGLAKDADLFRFALESRW